MFKSLKILYNLLSNQSVFCTQDFNFPEAKATLILIPTKEVRGKIGSKYLNVKFLSFKF